MAQDLFGVFDIHADSREKKSGKYRKVEPYWAHQAGRSFAEGSGRFSMEEIAFSPTLTIVHLTEEHAEIRV
jgi:hypothetical protein